MTKSLSLYSKSFRNISLIIKHNFHTIKIDLKLSNICFGVILNMIQVILSLSKWLLNLYFEALAGFFEVNEIELLKEWGRTINALRSLT